MIRIRILFLMLPVLLTGALYALPYALISHALRPAQQVIGEPPDWLSADDVVVDTRRGSVLRGWYHAPVNARATVVLLHPYRGNRRSMLGRARFLAESGYAVLLVDLQAHGESVGERITFGWFEADDAAAAVNYARARREDLPVFVLGRSLGGAAALLAEPGLAVDGLILEAVFPSMSRAMINRARLRLGALGDWSNPLLLWHLDHVTGLDMSTLSPIDRAPAVSAPVLILSGDQDRRTTPTDTQELYASFNEPKSLWLVPNAAHVDLHAHATVEFERRVLGFLESPVAAGELARAGSDPVSGRDRPTARK